MSKIIDNGIVREMTQEENAELYSLYEQVSSSNDNKEMEKIKERITQVEQNMETFQIIFSQE